MPCPADLELSRQTVQEPELAAELIAKEEKIAETITRQINFTRDYEDMGITAPAWQNVGVIIRQATTTLPMKNIRVMVDRPDLEIYADPLLGKVFYNLIDNAVKYGGGKMTSIRISSRETNKGLCLLFEDDGAGIAAQDKKHLFERGFGRNTGLGLFLSREILAITGITIKETGDRDSGARFEMDVPKGDYRFSHP